MFGKTICMLELLVLEEQIKRVSNYIKEQINIKYK